MKKILDETLSDLEMANDKCNQLSIDLDIKTSELEKLRIFKFMVRNSETREESITSKVNNMYVYCFILFYFLLSILTIIIILFSWKIQNKSWLYVEETSLCWNQRLKS